MASPLTSLTDEELVERVPVDAPGDRIWQQAPYLLEMQRRLLVAIRDFNEKSGRQAATMIGLTVAIVALTIILGIIAGVQLWAMLKGGA